MAYNCATGAGTLYEFYSSGNVKVKIENTTISNGVLWSGNCTKFYFIDSPTYEIHQYDYDIKTGNISNKTTMASIAKETGLPDGRGVIRINPKTGETVSEVIVPVPKVTSCAFGGAHLDEFYITTAKLFNGRKSTEKIPTFRVIV